MADIEKIKRKVKKIEPGSTIRLGGMTDCFQPIERKHKVTYEVIKALNEQKVHYLIVTKSDLVADPDYLAIMDKELAHIQISITTTDDETSLTYEKAPVPSKRIKAIETLQEAGFDVQVRLSPFIPELIDINRINQIKCDKILVEFLRVNSWIKKWFGDVVDLTPYTLKEGNYKHLPLDLKLEYLSQITGFKEKSVCEDHPEHYDYWQQSFNQNQKDCCNLRRSNE